ncbi:hypothetical protein RP20_CCG006548 [Aedes albopictus]|nr:hypothetical protein RP20_CCG006548 [Aedes albopictus]
MSWVVVLFCVLALSLEQGGVETKSVDQQELPSCDRAYGFFASINVTIKPANNDQAPKDRLIKVAPQIHVHAHTDTITVEGGGGPFRQYASTS